MKILVIRNDKLGDFMLAYPSFESLKLNLPQCELHALVPEYTQGIADVHPAIDKIIIDPGKNSNLKDNFNLLLKIKEEKYDAVITLYSTTRIGFITLLAAIPYRLAPASKLAQIFYNKKLVQRRSRSEKPEYLYNLDVIDYFLKDNGVDDIKHAKPPYLSFSEEETLSLRKQFISKHNIPATHKLFFIHPGSGGSAVNLTPQQFSQLANNIKSNKGHTIILTAGPGEREISQEVANNLSDIPHVIFESEMGIIDFAKHIQFADLFISGSTGPLHIAGALDTPTVGFYPHRRSATSLRWQTLNSDINRLAISQPASAGSGDMSSIDINKAALKISSFLNKK